MEISVFLSKIFFEVSFVLLFVSGVASNNLLLEDCLCKVTYFSRDAVV